MNNQPTIITQPEDKKAGPSHSSSPSSCMEPMTLSNAAPAECVPPTHATEKFDMKCSPESPGVSHATVGASPNYEGPSIPVVSPLIQDKPKVGETLEAASAPSDKDSPSSSQLRRKRPQTAHELKMELHRMESKIQKGARMELELLNKATYIRKKRQAMTNKYQQLSKIMMKLQKKQRESENVTDTVEFSPAKLPPTEPSDPFPKSMQTIDLTED